VAQSVEHPILGFGSGHDPMGCGIVPHIGLHKGLLVQQGVCLIDSLPPLACSLSKNK